jgi:hypothetical protein
MEDSVHATVAILLQNRGYLAPMIGLVVHDVKKRPPEGICPGLARQTHICEWLNESFFMQPGQVLSEVLFDSAPPRRNCRQRGELFGSR